MKKKMVLYLLAMSTLVVLSGCGKQPEEQPKQENVTQTEVGMTVAEENPVDETVAQTPQNAQEEELNTMASEVTENVQESEAMENKQEGEETQMESNTYDVPAGFDTVQEGVTYCEMKEITYDSKTTGTTRKANVILPPGYSEDKEYPILYLLHGIGGDHNEWKGGEPVNVISNLLAAGEAKEMIVVMPNVRARANDTGNPQDIYSLEHYKAFDNFINDLRDDLMPFMEANYAVATGKENTAVAGLSMGGRESLYIGFSMPETFGYIGAFCPAPGLLAYTNFGVAEDGLFTKETFTLPDGSNNFVMIVAGKSDNIVGVFPSTYHATLEENGIEHVYYETEGGHDFNVWKHGLYNFVKNIF